MTQTLNGSCHCGAVHVQLDPGKPVAELALRACQCSFCRRQGSRTTSDPGNPDPVADCDVFEGGAGGASS